MSRFVAGVSEDLEKECREAMLHDNMNLGRLMVHAQQVEESRRRKRGRRERNLGPRIRPVQAMVRIHLEFEIGPSSRRVTSTQVILIFPGTIMPKGTSLDQRRAMIEMPSVTASSVVSVVVCMEPSAW